MIGIAFSGTTATAQDQGKFSGLVFGDFYQVLGHSDPTIEGLNGFWFRRIYLTYDRSITDKFKTRVRFEANSPGDFSTSGGLNPFLKDVYVTYVSKLFGVTLGLQPTPTFGNVEDFHGYRYIEKTPLDLYKMADSRDSGLAIRGKSAGDGRTQYAVMVGNDSGTKSETNKGKAIYLLVGHWFTENLYAETTADFRDKLGSEDWTTVTGFVGYKQGKVNAGLLYGNQERNNTSSGDVSLSVWSLYVGIQASETVKPFFRVDSLSGPVPGASTISYLKIDDTATPTLYIVGIEFKLADGVYLTPNVELVTYRDAAGPKPDEIIIGRLTYYAKF
ncbi:MAG: hypothetical protein C4342_03980 [Armatimonadota bacterium]